MDLQGARILLVDDTEANLDVLCALLEVEGYRIAMAPNGEIALRIAGRVRPDLILLDVMMPDMDGFEVCRRLKQNEGTREIPVIFITAENLTKSVVTGFEVGGVDYITKPFHNEEVLARVRTHLQIDRLTRHLEAANRQIQEATERKSRFLASMSHELRTPMNAIIGFTSLVLRRGADQLSAQHRDNLVKVTESAHHLLNLINDILDLSKIEAGRMEVNPARFDVKGLIASCCEAVSPLVRPGVTLRYEVSDEVGEAHTDKGRLQQILTNLLSNALKFTEKGEVKVRVARPPTADRRPPPSIPGPPSSVVGRPSEDSFLEIAVSDTGVGIPADALGYIFEEFRQVAGSHQRQKGTGLGLAITKGWTELLGGTISVESEVGKRSTFTVRIPMVYGKDDPAHP
ncbi:MAG: hypothetical protein A3F84_11060 [Candidatus Handelsmanbacteria bacterium RIFCSPLOWO2_12_FULL_64_10]|uniref:histidine kinase n=1 Tax=Handelsmanbacteria sp. (strain RIFCSPLOWO2_12_FULL_64_10) TaxID=1817868 RepID=A0A1F6C7W5_HANXR|nr:MAG: hypothetical protein A3F84_11060 [Candidatus Handelsmanbacteria bacterium RIFCSPLOWO2_12_FULL_64_10]